MLTSLAGPVLAFLPSPSFNTISLGPFTLRLYGLCIALGVIAAVWISSRRWEARGGNPDDIGTIALWAVPAGVIGARMYHVATDYRTYEGRWPQAFNITNGGLGIPGGILLGTLVGIIVVKRKGLPVGPLLDVVAPAIPVAQAIGRFGNWFNQELFGRPTTLPWGLKIDLAHRPIGYEQYATFHPTFLYEALWSLGIAGLLILIDRTRKLYPGELFCVYVLGYAIGRFWVEELRIDHASLIWGVRVNVWMCVVIGTVSAFVLIRNRLHPPQVAVDREREAETDEQLAADEAEVEAAGSDADPADVPIASDPVAAAPAGADDDDDIWTHDDEAPADASSDPDAPT
ncbi:prolipoprotein diacylglyceryl transferase [Aquihabitans sp. McL0605]|uniref:prolipoprotein diacylglyceryl transferase n=1 Tax=Aquihabitans sp. McL0605 TaxID=3415671 RepID=UPI003CE78F3A